MEYLMNLHFKLLENRRILTQAILNWSHLLELAARLKSEQEKELIC